MKTKPIDYTGCHPAIKEQLQKGNAVWCRCWNYEGSEKYKKWVIGYDNFPPGYYLVNGDTEFPHAEPIETKRVLKDPVSLMSAMVSEGWKFSSFLRRWSKPGVGFTFNDWELCGSDIVRYPDYFYEEIEC